MPNFEHKCEHTYPNIVIKLNIQFMDGSRTAEYYYDNIKQQIEVAVSAANKSVENAGHRAVAESGEGQMSLEIYSSDGKLLETIKSDEWSM